MATVIPCPPQSAGSPAFAGRPGVPDLATIKARQQSTWASGDYAIVGTTLQIVGELLCEALDLHAGERVLDIASGNGNAALAAARRWCEVTALDYVPSLLDHARARASAERLPIDLREGDAEHLPFEAGRFDVVLSTFGAMFAPDQRQTANEMLRVCRPGGRIGMANWTPDGFIGELFRVVGRHVSPPAGLQPPALWGTEDRLAALFGAGAASIQARRRHYVFRYRSAAHWVEVFRAYYGPVHRAFAALDAAGQALLEADLLALLARWNTSRRDGLTIPGEYLEVVVSRR